MTGHHWLSMSEFTDLITISQMTPGPIAVNSATFVRNQDCRDTGCSGGNIWMHSALVYYRNCHCKTLFKISQHGGTAKVCWGLEDLQLWR